MIKIKNEYRVFGLRRTGNHAIINWILKQGGENGFFANDQELDKPFNLSLPNGELDTLVHSYEEQRFSPTYLKLNDFYLNQQEVKVENRYNILILRDPFNLMASRIKSGYTTTWRTPRLNQVDLWVLYAKEFTGETNLLPNKVCINYNRWVLDKAYRKEIAAILGLTFTDGGFSEVSEIGGGSSFDGTEKNAKAAEMQVMDRWKQYKENSLFLDFFENRQVVAYYQRIFERNNEIDRFIEQQLKRKFSFRQSLKTFIHTTIFPPLLDYKLKERNKNKLFSN